MVPAHQMFAKLKFTWFAGMLPEKGVYSSFLKIANLSLLHIPLLSIQYFSPSLGGF